MEKIFLILSLLLIGSMGYSQIIPGVSITQRKAYMMKTYNINSQKADEYEQILASLQKENEQLKNRKISSTQFRVEQKKLYVAYGKKNNQLFSEGKYRTWSYCTQEVESYQVLSENKFIPYNTMRELYEVEAKWNKERKELCKTGGEDWKKHEKGVELHDDLNRKIIQILGAEVGRWYINYKMLTFKSLDNMDKYNVSYKDALAITQIEDNHTKKRGKIWKSRKKNAQKELELMASDDETEKQIMASVPSASNNWININHDLLEYNLKRNDGLNQAQISKFKTAYTKYAMDEYRIVSQDKLTDADKYKQLSALNEKFCKSVSSLFSANRYDKWYSWWKYTFERKMKQKGYK